MIDGYSLPKTFATMAKVKELLAKLNIEEALYARKVMNRSKAPTWKDYMDVMAEMEGYGACRVCGAPLTPRRIPGTHKNENVCSLFPVHRLPTFGASGNKCIKHGLYMEECSECIGLLKEVYIKQHTTDGGHIELDQKTIDTIAERHNPLQ